MHIDDFFEQHAGQSLSYDDLILLPGFVDFSIDAVDLTSRLTREISLNIPIVSSPMDTVSEADLAIALALQGGMGFLHYNMSPEDQGKQAVRVKRYQNGVIFEPITLPPTATIEEVITIRREQGYSTIPITHDGSPHGRFLGLITKYDYSTFTPAYKGQTVADRMMSAEHVTTANFEELVDAGGELDLVQANERLLDSHSAALPIVERSGVLRYLITRSDLDKHEQYPNAAVDRSQGLLVGAAVETWSEKAHERLEILGDTVDVIVFDTSQGHTSYALDLIRWAKRHYPELQVMGGNVVTEDACEALISAGADAIRVGMGSGSICTTQEVGGIGRGQATAVYACVRACARAGVPVVADGGIAKSADIVKALSLGAGTVMLGSLLACTDEAPGRYQIKDGIRLKRYRGMGSVAAMAEGSASRYGLQQSLRVPEGVEGTVPSRGRVAEWIPCLLQGVRQGLHKLGHRSLEQLYDRVKNGTVQVEKRSEAAKAEGRVHDLYSVGTERVEYISRSDNSVHDKSGRERHGALV